MFRRLFFPKYIQQKRVEFCFQQYFFLKLPFQLRPSKSVDQHINMAINTLSTC